MFEAHLQLISEEERKGGKSHYIVCRCSAALRCVKAKLNEGFSW